MATFSQQAVLRPAFRVTGQRGLIDKYFYFAMSLILAGTVVWGFSHTVNENLFHATVPRPLIVWFHGGAFSAWMVFFIFQSLLVRTRNVKWHRFLGWFGVALGTVMVPLGITTAIEMGRFDVHVLHGHGVEQFLILPLYDMLAFPVLFGLAVAWRKKPELHRRLMFIATCGLLGAAFGRIPYLGQHYLFYLCVDGIICLGVVRDLLVDRRIHKVYLTALPLLLACHLFVIHTMKTGSAWWMEIAQGLVG